MKNKTKPIFIIETFIDGKWQPTVGTELTPEAAKAKLSEWQNWLPERKFRIMPYKCWKDGMVLMAGLLMILLGITGWPSEVTRGMTAPGVYEYRQMRLTGDGPQGYDSWQNQLERRKGRGR